MTLIVTDFKITPPLSDSLTPCAFCLRASPVTELPLSLSASCLVLRDLGSSFFVFPWWSEKHEISIQ